MLLGTVAILALLGLRELVSAGGDPSARAGPEPPSDHAMESFAQEFARAYLTYDTARPELRERALAPFASDLLGADAGYAPARGRSEVLWLSVAQNQEALAGGRIVTIAARTTSAPAPVYLAVPVRRLEGGTLALAGYPALIGAPVASRSYEPPAREPVEDDTVLATVERVLRNYLAAEAPDLEADLVPGAAVTLPTRELRVVSLDDAVWADGSDRAVIGTVAARDRTGEYTLSYELGLRFAGGRPLIDFIETVPTSS